MIRVEIIDTFLYTKSEETNLAPLTHLAKHAILEGWVAKPAYLAISPAFRHREVQKDCQNRKWEIGYLPLENCQFLKTAYFKSLLSMWLWF